MIIFIIVFALFLALIARRILRKGQALNMQIKPYRYPIETRRSIWANRQGF